MLRRLFSKKKPYLERILLKNFELTNDYRGVNSIDHFARVFKYVKIADKILK